MRDRAVRQPLGAKHDLARSPSILWLWCVPTAGVVAASVLNGNGVLSLAGAGIVWTLATAWIGVGCYINGRRCGRVHCRIDGVLFPLLAVAGLLDVLGVVTFNWNIYWGLFLLILAASFVPEFIWEKYA